MAPKDPGIKDTFVFKAATGQVPWTDIVTEMDKWDPESGVPIYKMLGFTEREWAMIVQHNEAAPYIIQERAFNMGLIPVPKNDYAQLMQILAPSNMKPEDVIKGFNPEATFKRLKSQGVISEIPNHIYFQYKAYGWNNHKLFIDLVDMARIKFDWSKLGAAPAEAPRGWQPTKEMLEQGNGPAITQKKEDK